MTEPDVALTDFMLTGLCGVVGWLLRRKPFDSRTFQVAAVSFYLSVGLGALLGGLVHGFYSDKTNEAYHALWSAILIVMALAGSACWMMIREMFFGRVFRALCLAVAVVSAIALIGMVAAGRRDFLVAILGYLPGAVMLLLAMGVKYVRTKSPDYLLGLTGLGFTFLAVIIQRAKWDLHPVYFTHNAVYHVVQGIGLIILCKTFVSPAFLKLREGNK